MPWNEAFICLGPCIIAIFFISSFLVKYWWTRGWSSHRSVTLMVCYFLCNKSVIVLAPMNVGATCPVSCKQSHEYLALCVVNAALRETIKTPTTTNVRSSCATGKAYCYHLQFWFTSLQSILCTGSSICWALMAISERKWSVISCALCVCQARFCRVESSIWGAHSAELSGRMGAHLTWLCGTALTRLGRLTELTRETWDSAETSVIPVTV